MVYSYIYNKIKECGDYIVCGYYDVIVRHGVSNKELENFIEEAREILEEEGYNVYLEKEEYKYNRHDCIVKSNEILVAIRDNEEK